MNKKVSYIFIFTILIIIANYPIFASEWHAPRKNQERTGVVSDHQLETPLSRKWSYNAGWSISAPLVAREHIYHLADGHVYKIPVSAEGDSGVLSHSKTKKEKVSNEKRAGSDSTYHAATDTLFVGTGDKTVVMLNANTLDIVDTFDAKVRLVTAPHLLSNNTMVYATATDRNSTENNARVYIVKYDPDNGKIGDIKDYDLSQIKNNPNAEITGSFASLGGDRFLVPYNIKQSLDRGYVVAWQATTASEGPATLKPIWNRPTKVGVSTTPVYDKSRNRVYYVDKLGNVYAVNASNGSAVKPGNDGVIFSNPYNANNGYTLSNNSPALFKNILVVPYRYTENSMRKGKVLAIDVTTGQKLWEYNLPDATDNVATSPIVVTYGPNAEETEVHFGTAKGSLIKLSNIEGGQTALKAEVQKIPNYPEKNITSYYQGVGLASGIVAAGGLYLFGVNDEQNPNVPGLGKLYAYNTTQADFYVESVNDMKEAYQGQSMVTIVSVGNRGKRDQRDVEVTLELHNKNGKVRSLGTEPVNLLSDYQSKATATFSWQVDDQLGEGEYKLIAEINPAGPKRFPESDYTNNKGDTVLTIKHKSTRNLCLPAEKKPTRMVKDIYDYCYFNTDGERVCQRVEVDILETLTGSVESHGIKIDENESTSKLEPVFHKLNSTRSHPIKAGQGFSVETESNIIYGNDPLKDPDTAYNGAFEAYIELWNGESYLLKPTQLENLKYKWRMPLSWVPMFDGEGEVRYDSSEPTGNKYTSGGRAYYTDLTEPDGKLPFKVVIVASRADLSNCIEGEIEIKGSIFDDIYVRRINPAKPFNHLQNSSQIGPTWSGTTILDNYAKWWTGEKALPDNNYKRERFRIKNGNLENLVE